MDKKLTDWMIKKALECCIISDCPNCPMGHRATGTHNEHCGTDLMKNALDLINRKDAENERLQEAIDEQDIAIAQLYKRLDKAKAEAYKEFAERLKKVKSYNVERHENIVPVAVIDWIVKELVGEDNESKN